MEVDGEPSAVTKKKKRTEESGDSEKKISKKKKTSEDFSASGEPAAPEVRKPRRAATENALVRIRDLQRDDYLEEESSHDFIDIKVSSKQQAASALSVSASLPSSRIAANAKKSGGNSLLSGSVGGAMVASGQFRKDGAASGAASNTLRKRISRIGDSEWERAVYGEQRAAAVIKAIDRYKKLNY
jgi:hypothetical protein